MSDRFDVAVIGAGIAGASIAAELARTQSVILLEMEEAPGYHTTGRSAALFSKTYGPPPIRALSRASEGFFVTPPDGFADHRLLSPRGALFPARSDQVGALDDLAAEVEGGAAFRRVGPDEMRRLCPLLRDGYAVDGLWDDAAQDIDVDALHRGFLRAFKAQGGVLRTRAMVDALDHASGGWSIGMGSGAVHAGIVVNAAGAWADRLGGMAGAARIGLVPKRRTAAIVAAPDGIDPAGFGMVVDPQEQFYLKPEAGKLLISPADETPSDPCDAQPEELDIAICVDRIEQAFDLQVRRIEHKWAGLRSFVADKCPVVGFDPKVPGFFWLAGQGGYGIQSAPAMARVAAALVRGDAVPQDVRDCGFDPDMISPDRLGGATD